VASLASSAVQCLKFAGASRLASLASSSVQCLKFAGASRLASLASSSVQCHKFAGASRVARSRSGHIISRTEIASLVQGWNDYVQAFRCSSPAVLSSLEQAITLLLHSYRLM
jgi:hypothetical protein